MIRHLTLLLFLSINLSFTQQNTFSSNPNDVQFHTEDIDRFWHVFDQKNFRGKIWQKEYLDKGSIGLKNFIPLRIESGRKLAKSIRQDLNYYLNIRESTLNIASRKYEFLDAFKKLKSIYPEAVFPDVYFVIGRNNTGGTVFSKGLIIGAEKFGNPKNGFSPSLSSEYLDDVVAHELIHFQQNYYKNNSLLAQCIREGSADFIGELISGKHTGEETHYKHGEKNITTLWDEFLKVKDGRNWDGWLYGSNNKIRPKDLGYWIGYRICKSYYENAVDKKQAIYDMLNVKDFNSFLKKSGFNGQPDKPNKLKIKINKNIELLGLAYFIGYESVNIENKTVEIDGKAIPKKDWHNYGYQIYKDYMSYSQSEHLAKSFSVADHLWLDYLNAFLLQLNDAPNAILSDKIDIRYYINFSKTKDPVEAKQNTIQFLEGFNAFYKEIDFETYLKYSKKYYDTVISEIKNNLPNENFISHMESFYKKEFNEYILIPSLTIPKGMGFGIKQPNESGTKIFNIFGALDFQEFQDDSNLKMGFSNTEKLRELSIHEFGHSFVNPEVAKLPQNLLEKTAPLFEPIKTIMQDQGYNTWKICLYEHFTRAGEIIIAENMGDIKSAKKLLFDNKEKRQFKYISLILSELRKYINGEHTTYYEAVEKSMKELENYSK